MIQLRRGQDRGHFDHGWLDTYHTFSFAGYSDPAHHNFRALRVINEDRVAAGHGFGMHGHRDMEILTYVLEGELAHQDTLGTSSVLKPGEFQRMSAGTGIEHSEFNPSKTGATHLYQIWLFPDQKGLPPSYEQRRFSDDEKRGQWRLVASPDGSQDSLRIHQDARVSLSLLEPGQKIVYTLEPGRHVWLQILRGNVTAQIGSEVDAQSLSAGDAIAVSDEADVQIHAGDEAEIMLFDLA